MINIFCILIAILTIAFNLFFQKQPKSCISKKILIKDSIYCFIYKPECFNKIIHRNLNADTLKKYNLTLNDIYNLETIISKKLDSIEKYYPDLNYHENNYYRQYIPYVKNDSSFIYLNMVEKNATTLKELTADYRFPVIYDGDLQNITIEFNTQSKNTLIYISGFGLIK